MPPTESLVGYVLANATGLYRIRKRNAMRAHSYPSGRHRLGITNGFHCIEIPEVAFALGGRRRTWISAIIRQGRHSFAAMRRHTSAATGTYWIPAAAN